jgi:hypothetical protein
MFCMCTLFSEHADTESHFQFGGPRCLYKFKHRNTTIILIGNSHGQLQKGLSDAYADVFTNFAEEQSTKLFLDNENRHNAGFFNCMNNLSTLPKMPPDLSHYNDGWLEYIRFLNLSAGLDDLTSITQLAKQCNKEFSMAEYDQYMEYHLDNLRELSTKCMRINARLGFLMNQLYNKLVDFYICLSEIVNEYKTRGFSAEVIDNSSLIDLCIGMQRNTNIIRDLLCLHRLYTTSQLDIALLEDILDQARADNISNKTFIVVTEKSHVKELARLLTPLCVFISAISPDKKTVITPNTLRKFLVGNLDPKPSRSNCSLM